MFVNGDDGNLEHGCWCRAAGHVPDHLYSSVKGQAAQDMNQVTLLHASAADMPVRINSTTLKLMQCRMMWSPSPEAAATPAASSA